SFHAASRGAYAHLGLSSRSFLPRVDWVTTLLFAKTMKILFSFAILFALLPAAGFAQDAAPRPVFSILHPSDYQHYAVQFAADEREATGLQPPDEWPWMAANIPLFASSDK